MSNLEQMRRVLYRHEWSSVDEWVASLDDLATMTDDEIGELYQAVIPFRGNRLS